ncbi:MAG: ribonuclease R [Saprospiraceae bacterium]|jgi:ribonuclease R
MSKKQKPTINGKKLPVKQLKNQLTKLFAKDKSKRLNASQAGKKLKVANSRDSLEHAIKQLENEGLLVHTKEGKYKWNKRASIENQSKRFSGKDYIGRVDMIRTGAAYIVVEELEDDVYVNEKNLNGAMNKDIVKIYVPKIPGKRKPEGKVLSIEKRSTTHIIGRYREDKKYAIVYPLNTNNIKDVYVHFDQAADAKDGDPVVVEITDWGKSQNKGLWGKVTAVMSEASENDIAMQGILLSNGFDLDFPPEVLNQVKDIQPGVLEEEVAKRRDFRNITTFTIDPETARDFDDALSIEELEDGKFEVGVHIADVTHYVPEGSPLDLEALNRSTSVYLVDRVLPMLPEKLSNDLCSLNPHEDRYTFTASFIFDRNFKILETWFGRTVIHSDRRFSYEEAQEVIETGKGDYADEIMKMNEVALKLRKDKYKNGAISFESDEIKFELDEEGKPIGMYVKQRKEAHMMIEDFMLLANKSVAKYIAKKPQPEVPFVYRVHDLPNPDKLADFALFAKELGYLMNMNTPREIAKSFNGLYEAAKTNEQLKMLEPLAIRTMSKAEYTTDNIGHYGLAFDYYTHFTSPIRRYSDVLVHRYLDKNLKKDFRTNKAELEAKCKHISMQERNATNAERESVKYKQVEYIKGHIGEEFDGVVSGMIDRGMFIKLADSLVEGMVGFNTLDEPYDLAESRLKATGRKTRSVITMGQKLRVRILSADMESKQVEMEIVTKE